MSLLHPLVRPPRLPVALLALLSACATEKTLVIRSDPPGARVRIDDRTVGTTPLRIGFEAYGIRRVTLYKEGYRTHSERVRLKARWYLAFPLDLVTEVLFPFGWKDVRHYDVVLEPGEEVRDIPSLRSVIERANVLREAGPLGPRHLPESRPRVLPPAGGNGPGSETDRSP